MVFDELGRLTGQEIWAGDTAAAGTGMLVQRRSYTYRADGVPTAVGDLLRGDRAFTADAVGRVTGVQAEGWRETYAYDATGNLRDEDLSATAAQQAVAADPRITGVSFIQGKGRTRYERDAQGRVVSAARRTLSGQVKTWTYVWDPFDRLLRTVTPEGGVWQYSYDPIGRRTAKHRVDAQGATIQTTRFVWDGSQLVEQTRDLPGGGTESYTWDYEPGTHRAAAQTRRTWGDGAGQEEIDSAFHAIVTDLVGTPQELITPDGRVAWHTVTSLWGRTIADPDAEADCPLRFPGSTATRRQAGTTTTSGTTTPKRRPIPGPTPWACARRPTTTYMWSTPWSAVTRWASHRAISLRPVRTPTPRPGA